MGADIIGFSQLTCSRSNLKSLTSDNFSGSLRPYWEIREYENSAENSHFIPEISDRMKNTEFFFKKT